MSEALTGSLGRAVVCSGGMGSEAQAEAVGRVILYSGGMDSYVLRALTPHDVCLYVNLHTRYSRAEMKRLDSGVQVVDFPGLTQYERPNGIIPLRNLFLVALASQYGAHVYLGATKGDRVRDKDHEFANRAAACLSYIWYPDYWTQGKSCSVRLPFKELTKAEIVGRYLEEGRDPQALIENSFSCYTPHRGRECGACKPCFRKWVAFTLNNLPTPTDARPYIRHKILPLIEAGSYGRKEEEGEILRALEMSR